jgi:hypothetical protein
MNRPLAVLVALSAAGALLAGGAVPRAAGAEDERGAGEMLERARDAAVSERFDGLVAVEWTDVRGRHRAELPVRGGGGVISFGTAPALMSAGATRLVRRRDGWARLWDEDVVGPALSPAAKYALSIAPGPPVAGRATHVVVVARAGQVRERWFVDDEIGLLLRREVLDHRGALVRAVGFVAIGATSAGRAAPVVPRAPRPREPVRIGRMAPPLQAPRGLGAGYKLLGAYREREGLAHLFYSDGLHGLSVFQQRGRLAWSRLPSGGTPAEVGGRTVRAYALPGGETLVWDGGGVTYTVVSDAPIDDIAAVVRDLPTARRPSRLAQIASSIAGIVR